MLDARYAFFNDLASILVVTMQNSSCASGRIFLCLVLLLVLAGCGVPAAVTVVGVSLDGASLLASNKTLSDHAISGLTRKDCASVRTFAGAPWCADSRSERPGWSEVQGEILTDARKMAEAPQRETSGEDGVVVNVGEGRVEFIIDSRGKQIAQLTRFPETIAIYGVVGERGTLEVYAYDPVHPSRYDTLTLIFTVPGYAMWPDKFVGIIIHGNYFPAGEFIV